MQVINETKILILCESNLVVMYDKLLRVEGPRLKRVSIYHFIKLKRLSEKYKLQIEKMIEN